MKSGHFIFDGNAQEVIKVTDGRVTGYIAASIPAEVLQIWRCRLAARLERMRRLRYRVRPRKHPGLKPKRARTRRQRPKKRHRARVRTWTARTGNPDTALHRCRHR